MPKVPKIARTLFSIASYGKIRQKWQTLAGLQVDFTYHSKMLVLKFISVSKFVLEAARPRYSLGLRQLG